MGYEIKRKRGRPCNHYKVRSIKSMTPHGFKVHEIKSDKVVFKRC